jgi:predicted MFS family arabinose efflux permease
VRLSPEAVRQTVAAIGGAVTALSERIFLRADHPEQAARQVAGLIALGQKHGVDALQIAAAAALTANVHSYAFVRAWLASGRTGLPCDLASPGAGLHENLRGPTYYH